MALLAIHMTFLSSYLTGRSQFVEFSGHKSDTLPTSTGLPQCSVLGPLLFLIYINDLPLVSNIFDMLMYADDATLYCLLFFICITNLSHKVVNIIFLFYPMDYVLLKFNHKRRSYVWPKMFRILNEVLLIV